MIIKSFSLVLRSTLNEKYPNLKVDFYVSRQNRYVHMGLDQPLHSISYFQKLLMIWRVFGQQENIMAALFFLSWIDSFSKVEIWSFDNKKKVWLGNCVFKNLCVPFKRQSMDARVPLKTYPTSPDYDLYAAESKILRLRESLN